MDVIHCPSIAFGCLLPRMITPVQIFHIVIVPFSLPAAIYLPHFEYEQTVNLDSF